MPAADVELRLVAIRPKGLPDAVKARPPGGHEVMTNPKVAERPAKLTSRLRHLWPSDACKTRKRDQELDRLVDAKGIKAE